VRLQNGILQLFLVILLVGCGSVNKNTIALCSDPEVLNPNYEQLWVYASSQFNNNYPGYEFTAEQCKNNPKCVETWFEKIWEQNIQTANEWKRKVEDKEIAEVLDEIADVPLGSSFEVKRSNLLVIEQKYIEVSNLCK
jgi:hypothetical protein